MRAESHERPGPRSDLAEVIESRYGPATPVLQDLAAFGDALGSRKLHLDLKECYLTDDGKCWITLSSRSKHQEVRPGDAFMDGVVLTADAEEGTCAVHCRPVRLVCTNGQIMPLSRVLETPEYVRGSDDTIRGTIPAVVTAAFAAGVLVISAELLRRAAQIPADSLATGMAMLGLAGRAPHFPLSVHHGAMQEEPTVYGVLNAITRAARDSEDIRMRVQLEQFAGRMIEKVSGLPAHAPSWDLQPV